MDRYTDALTTLKKDEAQFNSFIRSSFSEEAHILLRSNLRYVPASNNSPSSVWNSTHAPAASASLTPPSPPTPFEPRQVVTSSYDTTRPPRTHRVPARFALSAALQSGTTESHLFLSESQTTEFSMK